MTLPYDQVGVGPPVVLLHAGAADRSMWSEVLPLPGFRAIIPDLPDFRAGSVVASLRAPLELIPGAGHLAPMEDPEAFRSLLLLRFLA